MGGKEWERERQGRKRERERGYGWEIWMECSKKHDWFVAKPRMDTDSDS